MKPLSRLESLIADILERPAWTLSARKLHPLELTAALTKAMERRAVRLVDRVLAPDAYEVAVNPNDLAAFGDAHPVLEHELAEYLRRTIAERDLSCNRPPTVQLASSANVRTGRVQVTARFTPRQQQNPPATGNGLSAGHSGSTPPIGSGSAPARPPRAGHNAAEGRHGAALEMLDGDGRTVKSFSLADRPLTIGRRNDVDVPLLDGKVSREHARIERRIGGYTVTDLQSLNGTLVNGQEIRGARALRDGDVVEVGHFRLRFREQGTGRF